MEPSKSLPDRQASGGENASESIKIRNDGLTILADPPSADLDVVFVHGLTGHPRHTWTFGKDLRDTPGAENGDERPSKFRRLFSSGKSSKIEGQTGVFWPLDLLNETLPNARIATYGYDSKLRHRFQGSVSQSTILDIGQNLLVDLETFRQSQPARRLLFVAHSLGGIIVKEALRRSEGHRVYQKDFYSIYDATIALMFFGTPHRGADPFGLLRGISETLIGLAGYNFNDQLVNSLLPNSERLKELREEFSKMSRTKNWLVYSFQEEYGLRLLNGKKVVEDTSSNLDDPTVETTQHIAGDHMGMCRFEGVDDSQYNRVAGAFRRLNRLGFLQNPQAETNDEVLKACLESLAFKQIDDRLMNIRRAHSRTCKWLLQQTEYKNWLDRTKASEHHGFLWIKGKPGAGKSTIMKYAFQQSKKIPAGAIIVSYFFNARGDALEKSTIGMYRSIVYQILLAIPHLQTVFSERFPKSDAAEAPEWRIENLQDFLRYAIQNSREKQIIVYIDALDECEEDEVREMIEFLEEIGQEAVDLGTPLSICLSSRHYPHISIKKGIQLIVEGQQGHYHDIAAYVNSTLKAQGQRAKLEDIKSEILRRASGVFLWVVLVVQMLNKAFDQGRMHEMEKRLNEIPDELNDLFADILSRDTDNLDDSILLLQWVLFARRPMKPIELHLAVLCGIDSTLLKSWSEHQINLEDTKRFILSSSKGLVEISKSKDQTVQFIHESVRDFFLKKDGLARLCSQQRQSPRGLAEDRLRECCYQYITIDKIQDFVEFSPFSHERKQIRDNLAEAFPFVEYAVHNIFAHSNEAEHRGLSQASFLNEYFVEGNSRMKEWIVFTNMFERFGIRIYPGTTSILYVLSEQNLSALVKLLLSVGADPNYVGSDDIFEVPRYAVPLQAASANGHVDMVRMLRNAGARVNKNFGGEFGLPIAAAIRKHRHAVVRALLEVVPSPRENVDKNEALLWAIQEKDEFVLHLLLEKGANPNTTFSNGKTALHTAIIKCCRNLAEKLLRSGADFNMTNEDKDELLRSVIITRVTGLNPDIRRVEIVNLLLKNGASINTTDDAGYTVLLIAMKHRHDLVTALLLEKGADIHAKEQYGKTPLHLAASRYDGEAVAKLLLEKGADVHAKEQYGKTPLHVAATLDRGEAVAKLLLEKGADIHAKDQDGETPLHLAASRYNCEAVVKLLLEKGADVQAKNEEGDTPLHLAAPRGNEAMVKLLLEKGSDVHAKNQDGETPLHLAASWYDHGEAVTKLLLEKGADVHAKNEGGYTPLELAAHWNHRASAKLLLEKGADPNIKNTAGDTR